MPFLSSVAVTFFLGTTVLTKSGEEQWNISDVISCSSYCADYVPVKTVPNFSNGFWQKEMNAAMSRLHEIELLSCNWNGNGAEPFSSTLVSKCRNIISNLNIIPQLYPTANGSIQLEYYKADGSLLEFNIFDKKITMFKKSAILENGKRKRESRDYISEEVIRMEVEQFYE